MDISNTLWYRLRREDSATAHPTKGDEIRVHVEDDLDASKSFDIFLPSLTAAVLHQSLGRALKPRPIGGGDRG